MDLSVHATAFLGAFLTGLLGSAHCIGMCGGFAACAAVRTGRSGALLYTLGRLTTYASLGLVGGLLGGLLVRMQWVGLAVASAAVVFFAGRLAGLIPERKVRWRFVERVAARAYRLRGPAAPWMLGLSTALLPCGLVYAALAMPVVAATPLTGAIAMVLFGLGTAPALLLVSWGGFRLGTQSLAVRRFVAALVLVLGLLALWHRVPAIETESVPDCCRTE
jgi:sulfite exporter TauE/SafE